MLCDFPIMRIILGYLKCISYKEPEPEPEPKTQTGTRARRGGAGRGGAGRGGAGKDFKRHSNWGWE